MKKIYINTNSNVDEEVIFERFKEICKEEFKEFKLQIGEHIYLQEEKKNETERTDNRDKQKTL